MLIHRLVQRPASSSQLLVLTLKHLYPNSAYLPNRQIRVICTLEFIDSIKSLKRSPQHIFVEAGEVESGSELRSRVALHHSSTVLFLLQKFENYFYVHDIYMRYDIDI
ncbi:hypothetical protein Avbf_17200 [Armadillidium vulgare]|nr:hypothetical protein Avbf_17200 [Armadillidium vulgare]